MQCHTLPFLVYEGPSQHVKWQRRGTKESWVGILDLGKTKKDGDANKKFEKSLFGTNENLFPFDVLVLA